MKKVKAHNAEVLTLSKLNDPDLGAYKAAELILGNKVTVGVYKNGDYLGVYSGGIGDHDVSFLEYNDVHFIMHTKRKTKTFQIWPFSAVVTDSNRYMLDQYLKEQSTVCEIRRKMLGVDGLSIPLNPKYVEQMTALMLNREAMPNRSYGFENGTTRVQSYSMDNTFHIPFTVFLTLVNMGVVGKNSYVKSFHSTSSARRYYQDLPELYEKHIHPIGARNYLLKNMETLRYTGEYKSIFLPTLKILGKNIELTTENQDDVEKLVIIGEQLIESLRKCEGFNNPYIYNLPRMILGYIWTHKFGEEQFKVDDAKVSSFYKESNHPTFYQETTNVIKIKIKF